MLPSSGGLQQTTSATLTLCPQVLLQGCKCFTQNVLHFAEDQSASSPAVVSETPRTPSLSAATASMQWLWQIFPCWCEEGGAACLAGDGAGAQEVTGPQGAAAHCVMCYHLCHRPVPGVPPPTSTWRLITFTRLLTHMSVHIANILCSTPCM